MRLYTSISYFPYLEKENGAIQETIIRNDTDDATARNTRSETKSRNTMREGEARHTH